MSVTTLNPASHHPPAGQYSHVAIAPAGSMAFIAGQVAIDSNGELVGAGDAGLQTTQVFANIANLVAELGATPADIVELRTFVVGPESLDQFRGARSQAFAELFPDSVFPPNTLVVVSGLASEEIKVEVSAVVALGLKADE